MNNSSGLDSLATKTIQTARESIHYEIPVLAESQAPFNFITTEFLRGRVNYAVNRLLERLKMTTSNHLSDRLEPVSESAEILRTRLLAVIDDLPEGGISSMTQLSKFCDQAQSAVYLFKSDRQRYLNIIGQLSEVFYKVEQDVIKTIFNLPSESTQPDNPNSGFSKDLNRVNSDLEFALMIKTQVILKISQAPDVKTFQENMEYLIATFDRIDVLLDKFPRSEDIKSLPAEVQIAVYNSLNKFLKGLETFLDQHSFIEDLYLTLKFPVDTFEKTEGAKEFYEGLVTYKKRTELLPGLNKLKNTLKSFSNFRDQVNSSYKATLSLLDLSKVLTDEIGIFLTIERIANFDPAKIQLSPKIVDFLNQKKPVKFLLTNPNLSNSTTISSTSQPDHIRDKNPEQDIPTIRKVKEPHPGNFIWSKASPEEQKTEIISRICHIPNFSVLKYLYENTLWNDLGKACEFLNFGMISNARLSSIVGKDRLFSDIPSLVKTVFPEINSPSLISQEESPTTNKRFSWQSKSNEEVHQEVKRRLFAYWPLLKNLDEQNPVYLMEILTKMTRTEFNKAGLNDSCFGTEKSIFDTIDQLIREVFYTK